MKMNTIQFILAAGIAVIICIGALIYYVWSEKNKVSRELIAIYTALSAIDEIKEYFRTNVFSPNQPLSQALKLVQMHHEDGYSPSSIERKIISKGLETLNSIAKDGMSAKMFKRALDQLASEHKLAGLFDKFNAVIKKETHPAVNVTLGEYLKRLEELRNRDKGPALTSETSTIRMLDTDDFALCRIEKENNPVDNLVNQEKKLSLSICAENSVVHYRTFGSKMPTNEETISVLHLGEYVMMKIPNWVPSKCDYKQVTIAPSYILTQNGKFEYSNINYAVIALLEFKKGLFSSDNRLLITKAEPTAGMRVTLDSRDATFLLLRAI
ncbi:hypothetical protein ENBRE01_1317 [Enteropsectra breve]|nr:hypothetical protein ENBRE01_1317 [Enteropsectra breve]